MQKRLRRPRDSIELAKLIGDIAIGKTEDIIEDGKNPNNVELGRQGGLKGGIARAEKLTAEQRQEIAKKAAQKRWGKD